MTARKRHGLCKHCGKRPGHRPRELCSPCYDNKAIRVLYPTLYNIKPDDNADMTEEQLDRLIAQQLPTMPGTRCTGAKRHWTPPIIKTTSRMSRRLHVSDAG